MRLTPFLRLILAGAPLSLLACSELPTSPNANPWRYLSGHVEALSVSTFRGGRPCWIYLPPGYAMSDRRYPVLYMNDGSVAFDGGLHVNRICEDLIRSGEIRPLIVVAVSVPDSERFYEYTPWPWPERLVWGGGDFYVRAIRDTLKPEIDRRFRTLPDPSNTAISGCSLGGLISAYAGYAYASTFGMVAAFSPSYGWSGQQMYFYVQTHGKPSGLRRYYQDTGTVHDNGISRMEQLLVAQGFIVGTDLMSITVEGAEHRNGAWERRFPGMLRFLFGS